MIGIGARPVEEELFSKKPVEPIAVYPDGKNVKGDPQMVLNGFDEQTKTIKIHRLVLSRTAIVELLCVESPSKIWVRLINHITDTTLTFREPFDLKPKMSFKIGDYAIAPVEERAFRRCRIEDIIKDNNGMIVKVFFIDDATRAVLNPECLCEISEHYTFYPWQAIQISMFQLCPGESAQGLRTSRRWTKKTCDVLRELLESFQLLQVDVVLSSVVFNDYARATPCNIFGIVNELETDSSLNILNLLLNHGGLPIFSRTLYDAADHQFFETEYIPSEEREKVLTIHRSIPDDWKMETITSKDEELTQESDIHDWDPEICQIPPFEEKDLAQFADEKGDVLLCVEGSCTKSPSRWYARPIHRKSEDSTNEEDPIQWMINGNEELLSAAEQLDTYYSLAKNRKPLTDKEITNLLKMGKDVFAVCAANEDKSAYTGEWQRVQILKCEAFAEVLFLDSGGIDFVLTSSLYRIHEQHCRYLPKCLQLSIHGLTSGKSTSRNGMFKVSECEMFKSALKVDVPLVVNLKNIKIINQGEVSQDNGGPLFNKNVFFVRDMRSYDENISFIDYLIERGFAVDDKVPVEWV